MAIVRDKSGNRAGIDPHLISPLKTNGRILVAKARCDLTLTTDQVLTAVGDVPQNYRVGLAIANRVSGSVNGAVGGLYTAPSKGGTAIVANSQTYSSLNGADKCQGMTIAAAGNALTLHVGQKFYFSLTTGNTGALVADVYVYAEPFI